MSIAEDELEEAEKLARSNPGEPLIGNDKEPKPVLTALVTILKRSKNLSGRELATWIESIGIEEAFVVL